MRTPMNSSDLAHEQLLGQHAHNLRMVVSSQVDNLRKRVWSMYHEARTIKATLTQERTPMGFDKYELRKLLETLESVEKLGASSNLPIVYIVERGERNYGSNIIGVYAGTTEGLEKAHKAVGKFMAKERGANWKRFEESTHVACWTRSVDYVHIRENKLTH